MSDDQVVSVLLSRRIAKEILYGAASLLMSEGFQSVDVVGHYMPDPSTLGPEYGAYAFALIDPGDCRLRTQQRMVLLPGLTGDWAGTYELGLPPRPIARTRVVVYPVTTGGTGETVAVLEGLLQMP